MSGKTYNIVESKLVEEINNATGEIISAKKKIVCKDIEEFGLLFLKTLESSNSLTGTDMNVLLCAWFYSSKTDILGNLFANNKDFKSYVRLKYKNISDGSINNSISKLRKLKFLIKGEGKSCYRINPEYFWKGTLKERSRAILSIEYGEDYKVK